MTTLKDKKLILTNEEYKEFELLISAYYRDIPQEEYFTKHLKNALHKLDHIYSLYKKDLK